MFSPFRAADAALPMFDGKNTEEKLEAVSGYLYMLNEQLRYTMSNLGAQNFNDTSLREIGETIRQPLNVRLDGTDNKLAALSLSLNGLSLSVTEGENSSKITLKSGSAELSSASIDLSGLVKFSDLSESGATTINGDNITTGSLSSISINSVTIKGSRFMGLLQSDSYDGGAIDFCYEDYDTKAGGVYLNDAGEGSDADRKYRMFIYTGTAHSQPFSMKLFSAAGISADATDVLWLQSGTDTTIKAMGKITLNAADGIYIGSKTIDEYIRSVLS